MRANGAEQRAEEAKMRATEAERRAESGSEALAAAEETFASQATALRLAVDRAREADQERAHAAALALSEARAETREAEQVMSSRLGWPGGAGRVGAHVPSPSSFPVRSLPLPSPAPPAWRGCAQPAPARTRAPGRAHRRQGRARRGPRALGGGDARLAAAHGRRPGAERGPTVYRAPVPCKAWGGGPATPPRRHATGGSEVRPRQAATGPRLGAPRSHDDHNLPPPPPPLHAVRRQARTRRPPLDPPRAPGAGRAAATRPLTVPRLLESSPRGRPQHRAAPGRGLGRRRQRRLAERQRPCPRWTKWRPSCPRGPRTGTTRRTCARDGAHPVAGRPPRRALGRPGARRGRGRVLSDVSRGGDAPRLPHHEWPTPSPVVSAMAFPRAAAIACPASRGERTLGKLCACARVYFFKPKSGDLGCLQRSWTFREKLPSNKSAERGR